MKFYALHKTFVFLAIGGCLLFSSDALAGVDYADPGWRYTYDGTFAAGIVDEDCLGGVCPPGYGKADDTEALDGTWLHDQGDKWDGSAPGDALSIPGNPVTAPDLGPAGTSPGGAGAFTDGGTTFIGFQDAGNPETHGWCQADMGPCEDNPPADMKPANTNRRVYFGHDMTQDGPLASEVIISSTGMTFSFRARIPTDASRLDDIWLEGGYNDADFNSSLQVEGIDFLDWQKNFGAVAVFPDPDPDKSEGNADANNTVDETDFSIWEEQFGDGAPGTIPWFQDSPNGRGAPMVNGRGMINIVQNFPEALPANEDTMVGFSLVTSTDVTQFCDVSGGALCTGSGKGGLIMNNLNGDVPTAAIDSESGGTLNILEFNDDADLNDWNEFWITMENNGAAPGNVLVTVYMNGSTSPAGTFDVTLASAGNAVYADFNNPFMEFGISANDGFGSLDMDFFSYAEGVILPTAALSAITSPTPEPSSMALFALGLLGLSGVRRRRR